MKSRRPHVRGLTLGLVAALAGACVGGPTPASAPSTRPDGSVDGVPVAPDARSPDGGSPDGLDGARAPRPDAARADPAPPSGPGDIDPGVAVSLTAPPSAAEVAAMARTLTGEPPATAAAFAARWPATPAQALGYDPLKAQNMDLLQASHIRLNDGELAALGRDGFVITARQSFPSFFLGYKTIYADDLPVFISADSILHAVHRSFDDILAETELKELVPQLDLLLSELHANLARGAGRGLPAEVVADVDLYLTVARKLMVRDDGSTAAIKPVAGASPANVDGLVARINRAGPPERVPLFGDPGRNLDFSQFRPRGHYDRPELRPYFRTMMWLGRTDLRLVSFESGQASFNRRQFQTSLLLAELLDKQSAARWQAIENVLRGFMGESDNMTVLDFERLRAKLGVGSLAELAGLPDQKLAQAIVDGGFGLQRIASQILLVPPEGSNLPLDRVFLFFGQRFIIDSQVFSDVVFDRVLPEGGPQRTLPDPLDVAFAALGNSHAAPLLAAELDRYRNYPAALHAARAAVDAHEPAFWNGSLYGAWLGTLRAMSPPADLTGEAARTLPAVARTAAWSRRVLNTQLASWAELRHDTLLYSKQSYSSFPTCEFPDAYVDPYPELWAALARFAERGIAAFSNPRAAEYFGGLRDVALRLEDMARRQIAGTPFTAEQLAWVNEAVHFRDQAGYAGLTFQFAEGWYVRLFANYNDVTLQDPTIADVHTGDRILHAATGLPRLMVVTFETCQGPRAYTGVVSAYHEVRTEGFQRLNDAEWAPQVMEAPDVPWMRDLVQR